MARATPPRTNRGDPESRSRRPSRDHTAGIYADRFTDAELSRIIAALDDPTADLTGAIQATHVILDRILARMDGEQDPDRWISLARTWGDTTNRLAGLMRTHRILTDQAADTLAGHIAAALDEVAAALHTTL